LKLEKRMGTDLVDAGRDDLRAVVRIQWGFRAVIAAIALVECWTFRFYLNFDGIFYMDMGDQYWRGDWHAALNSYWSPLYGLLTGLMFRLTKPGMRWEFPEVHLLNFAIFIAALFCFEFFWRELLAVIDKAPCAGATRKYIWALGYLLFTYLYLVSFYTHPSESAIGIVTPDLMVAAIMFLVSGMILQFTAGRMGIISAGLLGGTLGIGYFAKTAMLPFGLVVIATLLGVAWKRRSGVGLVGLALICFLATSAPFIAALSWNNHRFTFGDSGKLNVAWHVNGAQPNYRHWQGDGNGRALHPTREILDWPEVYEFATPIIGTYPVFNDPTYWWAGVDTRFHLVNEIICLKKNALEIAFYFVGPSGILVAIMLLMFFLSDRIEDSWRQLIVFTPILIPAAVEILMFAMLIWQPRYTSAAVTAVFGAVIASAKISEGIRRTKVLRAASLTLGLMVAVLLLQTLHNARMESRSWFQHVEVAEQLRAMGIEAGDHVALIGDGFPVYQAAGIDWARLDRAEIIAEVPHNWERRDSTSAFWNSDLEGQQTVLNALKSTGARAVVTNTPPLKLPPGWSLVGDTGYAVFLFS
jgi:hypothetical protein